MRTYLATALILFATATVAIAEKTKNLTETYTLEPDQRLRIEVPVGELKVMPGKGQKIEIDLRVTCKWGTSNCDKALEDIHVSADSSERRLVLEIDGYPKWQMKWIQTEGTIRVPAAATVSVEMGVGELEIEGLSGDQYIELGVGQVSVWADKSDLHSVAVEAGVGNAELHGTDSRVEQHRSMFIGNDLYWKDGPGKAKIKVEVGVGEANVWLD
jgi:hypothetical protein